ncbi:MAG: phosphoenolpyruvate--protein phosphotransferase [Balneolaceae bacterium]|nr:MAG: phosphoenolpyruvate--protein phosphotransferase [Balneolaceae bacterium]
MKEIKPKVLSGRPAAQGIAIGNIWILTDDNKPVHPEKISKKEIKSHLAKYEKAKAEVTEEYEKIKQFPDEFDLIEIMEAQIQTLNDPEVIKQITRKIESELSTVDYAIFSTYNDYIQLLEAADAKWANERTIDIVSVRDDLIQATKEKKRVFDVKKGEIVFADDISPTTMVKLSQKKIGGIVMEKGGLTSHAVILSQSLGIPCVMHAHWDRYNIVRGYQAIIDGSTGQVIVTPSRKQIDEYQKRREDERSRFEKALEWAQKPDKTKCGSDFKLRANVEFLEELPKLSSHGASGIGLLRTETILFETDEFDIDDQIEFYKQVVESVEEDSVTIRLFDAGGDKLIEGSEGEANPFLGWRGVRMLLDKKKLLKRQLEAIYRVGGIYTGRIKILIPMISRLEEIRTLRLYCEEVKNSLELAGVKYDQNIPIGIMVEVPSIAIMAEEAAKEADFFSLGTNDLTQYTLAVDRGNEKIAHLFDSFHPAIWKLIKMTKDAADKEGISVAVCGEMAGSPEAAACLLGLGINDLSMNSSSIPKVKSVLCKHTLSEMQVLSNKVLGARDLDQVHNYLEDWREF